MQGYQVKFIKINGVINRAIKEGDPFALWNLAKVITQNIHMRVWK